MKADSRNAEMWKAIVNIVSLVLAVVLGIAMVIDMIMGRVAEAALDGVLFLMVTRPTP